MNATKPQETKKAEKARAWVIRENHEPLGIQGGSGAVRTVHDGRLDFHEYGTRAEALDALRSKQQECAASDDADVRAFGARLFMTRAS